MEIETHNLEETYQVAQDFLSKLKNNLDRATIVFLSGDLGAGKTAFTQGLAKTLGVTEEVTSPTFVIQKIYHLPVGQKFNKMIHIDCYRLENDRDWEVLNMDNILTDPTNLVVVEWPEKIDQLSTLEAVKIEFKFIDENTRIIKILP